MPRPPSEPHDAPAAAASRRRVLVVGLGATGVSCVRYLLAQGYRVQVADTRTQPPGIEAVRALLPGAAIFLGGFDPALFEQNDLIVSSPGVPLSDPVLVTAARAGREIVGDIELFARVARAPILAITGANGKSTVTSLTGAMCRHAGLATQVGGNIGVPALDLLVAPDLPTAPVPDVYVLELSSFQLETTTSLDARAATVLNITPDHMDRYPDMAAYALAKQRVFGCAGTAARAENAGGHGRMLLNRDDVRVKAMALPGREVVTFGLDAPPGARDYGLVERSGVAWLARGEEWLMRADEIRLPGRHNLANVLAAMGLAETVGVTPQAMCEAAAVFTGLPHRTELVAEQAGVRWINDSKGTNVGATAAALDGMDAPVLLILGGEGKGQDFRLLRDAVGARTRLAILIGRDAPIIEQALAGCCEMAQAADMLSAVNLAHERARQGDVVLMSPACASFDMYRNYGHRGEAFRAAVHDVLETHALETSVPETAPAVRT